MRLHLLLLSLCFFSYYLSAEASNFLEPPQDKLQRFFGEFLHDDRLKIPISILDCYDQKDIAVTQDFLTEMFQNLDDEQVTNIPFIVRSYAQRLSPNALRCLSQGQNLQRALANDEHLMTEVLDFVRLFSSEDKQASISLGEQSSVESQNGDSEQPEKMIDEVGQVADDPVSDLKQIYQGFFAQAELNGTISVINCYNSTSAKLTLNVLSAVLVELSTGQFGDISNILVQYKKYLPSTVETCVNQDQELEQAYQKYKIAGMSLNTIFAAISGYAQSNYNAFHTSSTDLSTDDQAGSYLEVGKLIGLELQTVFV